MNEVEARNAEQALRGVKEILQSNFFSTEPPWVAEAAFALLMIKMKDALQILSRNGARIAFRDDIPDGDITKLISDMRNAVCHVGSPEHHMDSRSNTLSFGVMVGAGVLVKGPDYESEIPIRMTLGFSTASIGFY